MKLKQQHFSHDVNASRDEKILALRESWGIAGYGLYWLVIEYLFTTGGQARRDSGKLIAKAISEDPRKVQRFLEEAIDVYHLFESDRVHFWSNRLRVELEAIRSKTEKARNSVMHRHNKNHGNDITDNELPENDSDSTTYGRNTNVIRTYDERDTIIEIEDNRNNKYGKKRPYGEFKNVLLTEAEYAKCIDKHGEQVTLKAIEKLSAYKKANGRTYKSDYAALNQWAFDSVSLPQFPNQRTGDDIRLAHSIWDDMDTVGEVEP